MWKEIFTRFRCKPSFYTLEHSNSEVWQRIATYKSVCKHWRLALDASFSCNSTQIIRDSRHFEISCIVDVPVCCSLYDWSSICSHKIESWVFVVLKLHVYRTCIQSEELNGLPISTAIQTRLSSSELFWSDALKKFRSSQKGHFISISSSSFCFFKYHNTELLKLCHFAFMSCADLGGLAFLNRAKSGCIAFFVFVSIFFQSLVP